MIRLARPLRCARADPAKRITIHEIQDHPWYMKDLPPGVKEMNDNMRMPPAGSQARGAARMVACPGEALGRGLRGRRLALRRAAAMPPPTCRSHPQTEAEIRAVVQEAQKSSAMNPPGWEVGGSRAALPVPALAGAVPNSAILQPSPTPPRPLTLAAGRLH